MQPSHKPRSYCIELKLVVTRLKYTASLETAPSESCHHFGWLEDNEGHGGFLRNLYRVAHKEHNTYDH